MSGVVHYGHTHTHTQSRMYLCVLHTDWVVSFDLFGFPAFQFTMSHAAKAPKHTHTHPDIHTHTVLLLDLIEFYLIAVDCFKL